jgi:hypothetical protein
MSGHFGRKIYDNCYTLEFIDQQVNPCKYRVSEQYAENDVKCQTLNGPRANKSRATGELGNTNIGFRTDIESQLYNLDVPDSRCITLNTMNEKNERLARVSKALKVNYSDCKTNQDFEYSRLNIPVNNFRSVYINRFEYPIVDPREYVYYGAQNTEQVNNQRFGVNTQLQAKDKVSKPNLKPNSRLTK